MSDAESAVVGQPTDGTGAGYMRFLAWAEKKGEAPASTIQNWRNASNKVMEIEADWQSLNLVEFDLDSHLNRFQILKRTSYTDGSMNAYKSRTKAGIEAYRVWLQNGDWKPKVGGPRTSRSDKVKKVTATAVSATVPDVMVPSGAIGGRVPALTAMIEYPLPLRPGVRALLALPEDLTEKEAKRVTKFVESLAFTEQLANTAGQ